MKYKRLLILLVFWFVVCVYLFQIIYDNAREKAIADLNSRQMIHARQAQRGIEDFFKDVIDFLDKIAGSPHVIDLDDMGKRDLEFVLQMHPGTIKAVTRLNHTGRVIYTSPPVAGEIGRDVSHQPHIQNIIKSNAPAVSDVIVAPRGYRAVDLHVPVFKDGGFHGTLGILIDVLAFARQYLEEIRLGDTGYAWMTSQGGIELFCPVPGHVTRSVYDTCAEFPTILAMADKMLKGEQGMTTYVFDRIRGQKIESVRKHAVYLPIKTANQFWSIVVASSEDEVLSTLVGFRNRLGVLLGLFLLGSTFFSYYGMKAWVIVRAEQERKKAEQALRKQKEFTDTALDAQEDTFFLFEPSTGKALRWNRSFSRTTGYTDQEIAEMPAPGSYYGPRDLERAGRFIEGVLEKGRGTIELDLICKDGRKVPTEYRVSVMGGKQDDSPYFISIGRDITERKKMESALRESKEFFEQVMQQSPLAMWISDTNGTILRTNQSLCDILRVTEDQVIGKYNVLQDENLIEQGVMAQVQAVFEKLEPVRFRLDWTAGSAGTGDFKGARDVVIDVSMFPILDNQGNLTHVVCQWMDITERKKLEERIQQAQKMESIGSLAGGIAHDFNNLLYPIIGLAELLLEDFPADSSAHENAREILKAGLRGSDLVKQILAFSRQTKHKMIPVRVQNVLKEVVKLSRSAIPSNIEIETDIPPDCGLVMADSSQVHQVGMNLVTNAFHAVEASGGKILVELKGADLDEEDLVGTQLMPGPYVIISVSDTGSGMDPAVVARIFEPYFTTKEKGKGTGLGLATVYGIVREHNGEIKVYSEKGKGSTFKVYLPSMEKTPETASVPKTDIYQTGNERVLLVDDEEPVARLERQMLERLGYQVTSLTSSLDALDAFRVNSGVFDLVITDFSMPNMTGDQLARELMFIRPDIPVIICTGFSERINKENIQSFGVKGFLMKPVLKSEMAKMVRDVLDEK